MPGFLGIIVGAFVISEITAGAGDGATVGELESGDSIKSITGIGGRFVIRSFFGFTIGFGSVTGNGVGSGKSESIAGVVIVLLGNCTSFLVSEVTGVALVISSVEIDGVLSHRLVRVS